MFVDFRAGKFTNVRIKRIPDGQSKGKMSLQNSGRLSNLRAENISRFYVSIFSNVLPAVHLHEKGGRSHPTTPHGTPLQSNIDY